MLRLKPAVCYGAAGDFSRIRQGPAAAAPTQICSGLHHQHRCWSLAPWDQRMQNWWHCHGACQEGWDVSPFGLPWTWEQQERAPAGHLHKTRVFIPPAAGSPAFGNCKVGQ